MVASQVKGKSNVSISIIRLTDYQEETNNSCEAKPCQKASQGMKKVGYKYGPYSKVRLHEVTNENVARVPCDTFLSVILGVEFNGVFD